jgi:Domain of unknown function (DUF3560)
MQLNLFDTSGNTPASNELVEKRSSSGEGSSPCNEPNQAQEILDNRRDRFESRRERRLDNAHRQGLKNRKLSKSFYERSTTMARCIPMGQPILVGHHSEQRDRRFRRRLWDLMGKSVAANDKAKYYEEKAEAIESNQSISSDDPDAIEKLKEKIAAAIDRQNFMKAGNKIVKSKKLTIEQKIEQLEAARHSALILQPDFCGRFGYADYELTNNNANIRRMKQRLEQLEKAFTNAVEIGDTEEEYPDLDLTVRHARTINRVQLIFSKKPSLEIRNLLKSHGFRWAPSEAAWQRHLNGFSCRHTIDAIEQISKA